MFFPDESEYFKLCRNHKNVPVAMQLPSDTETPITIYAKVAQHKTSYMLESVEGGEKLARYSFIGFDPIVTMKCRQGELTVEGESDIKIKSDNPFDAVKEMLEEYKIPDLPNMPRFYGGAVGYLGYDLIRHLEKLPDLNLIDCGVPDSIMIIPRVNIVLDHVKHTLMIVVNTRPGKNPLNEYQNALALLSSIRDKLNQSVQLKELKAPSAKNPKKLYSNLTEEKFTLMVERAKEYIKSGDILQVVLSRKIEQEFTGEPFRVYRRLRRNNPSPYLFYLNFGEVVLAGSSPEMLIRVENSTIETRPIAGTRPRGSDETEDDLLSKELLSDTKERAEHLMLVDLGRNDVGKVSIAGKVKVPQFMEVEYYSHVMHLVSSVTGILPDNVKGFQALKACFPAGTVSGAPKIRAMEIIEELEPSRRGPYAGAVGYMGFNGNIDTAIAIRTIVFYDGKASVQVGAGIVADSNPVREFTETENKAGALIKALAEEDTDNCC